jgi:hypothetical protein
MEKKVLRPGIGGGAGVLYGIVSCSFYEGPERNITGPCWLEIPNELSPFGKGIVAPYIRELQSPGWGVSVRELNPAGKSIRNFQPSERPFKAGSKELVEALSAFYGDLK